MQQVVESFLLGSFPDVGDPQINNFRTYIFYLQTVPDLLLPVSTRISNENNSRLEVICLLPLSIMILQSILMENELHTEFYMKIIATILC